MAWDSGLDEDLHDRHNSPFSREYILGFLGLQKEDQSQSPFERYNKVGLATKTRSCRVTKKRGHKILEQDFGLRLHFDYAKYETEHEATFYRVFSYLTFSGASEKMGNNIWERLYRTHAIYQHVSFLEPKQLPPWSKRLQRKFDRAMNFFRFEPYIDPCNLPYQIAIRQKVKDNERLAEDEHTDEVWEEIEGEKSVA